MREHIILRELGAMTLCAGCGDLDEKGTPPAPFWYCATCSASGPPHRRTGEESAIDRANETAAFMDAIAMDALTSVMNLEKEDTPYLRRLVVRSLLSGMDGIAAVFKRYAIAAGQTYPLLFSATERAVLAEVTGAEPRPKRLATLPNFRFAVAMYMRHPYCTKRYEVDADTPGWNAVANTRIVRNRLTHPRGVRDLEVSDAEFQAAKKGHGWFALSLPQINEAKLRMIHESEMRARGSR